MWLAGSLPASLSDLMARLREVLRSSVSSSCVHHLPKEEVEVGEPVGAVGGAPVVPLELDPQLHLQDALLGRLVYLHVERLELHL